MSGMVLWRNLGGALLPRYLAITLLLLAVSSCSNEEMCKNERSFNSALFQQTWFISETPDVKNLGVAFSDSDGTFYEPMKIGHFDYCAQGKTIFIRHGYIWKERLEIEILSLDKETMTLRFPNGSTFKYFRAGR